MDGWDTALVRGCVIHFDETPKHDRCGTGGKLSHIYLSRGSARIDGEDRGNDTFPRPIILETCLYGSTCCAIVRGMFETHLRDPLTMGA